MKKLFSSNIIFALSIVIFLACSYWIYKNVTLEDLVGNTDNAGVITEEDTENSGNANFVIKDTDIVDVSQSGKEKVIVNGDTIDGLEDISDIVMSPDKNKICFLVHTVVPIWLYIYDLENENLIKVDVAKNCFWSPDSNYVAYNNHTTDVSDIDVYTYDLYNREIENISKDLTPVPTDLFRQCGGINWKDAENLGFECLLKKLSNIEDFSTVNVRYSLVSKTLTTGDSN